MNTLPRIDTPGIPSPPETPTAEEKPAPASSRPATSPGDLLQFRAWAEIDLKALADNVRRIQQTIHPSRLLVVVKKDAYGHGMIPVAMSLSRIGVRYLGVAGVGEGLSLREAGIETPIVNIGIAVTEEIEYAIMHRIDLTVGSIDDARTISETATRMNRPVRVHLKVDTGMGRLGLYPEQLVHQVEGIASQPNLEWVGLYSHLADCPADARLTREQLDRFRRVADAMKDWLPLRHLGASGAIGDERLHFDMMRVGIAAYGADPNHPDYKPVMTMKSRIIFTKHVPKDRPIGYGATYVTPHPTRVGVVAAGYGNGYPRRVSNRGHVLINGRPAPILGTVCMDQLMIDLREHPCADQGATVLLFGREDRGSLPVWEVAQWADTISYEILCCAGAMTPRVYSGFSSPGGKSETGGE